MFYKDRVKGIKEVGLVIASISAIYPSEPPAGR